MEIANIKLVFLQVVFISTSAMEKKPCEILCQPPTLTSECGSLRSAQETSNNTSIADAVFLCCLGYGNLQTAKYFRYIQTNPNGTLTKQEEVIVGILDKVHTSKAAQTYAECFRNCLMSDIEDWTEEDISQCLSNNPKSKPRCRSNAPCKKYYPISQHDI